MKRMPTDYSLRVCRLAREQGVDILEGTGITMADLESMEFLPLADHLMILDRYTRLQDESDWGFRLGQQLSMANHGPLGFGAVCAPTIRDGIAFMARYIATRASYLHCRFDLPHGAIHLIFDHDTEMAPYLRRSCETLAIIFQSYIETAGGSAAPTVWRFPFPEPENRTDYDKWLHGGYSFGAKALRLELPASVGMVPSAFRNDDAYQSTLAQCEAILQRASASPLVDKVRGILAGRIDRRASEDYPVTAIPSADEVAAQLQMSRRTLIRQLKDTGATFQGLKDELLAKQISALVPRASLSMADIANRLGYADAANFTRACRRIFGATPRELRSGGQEVLDS